MKRTAILFLGVFGVLPMANSTTLVPVSSNDETAKMTFTHRIRNKDDQLSHTFLSNEVINFQFNMSIENDHVGQVGQLYLVAQHDDLWYQYTSSGIWKLWNKQESTLQVFKNKVLEKEEIIPVLTNQTLPSGEFLVYTGYQIEGNQSLFYNASPAAMVVFNNADSTLHPIKNKALLSRFFVQGLVDNQPYPLYNEGFIAVPSPVSSDSSSSTPVSQTNLQEIGIDEADRIKTDGKQLYVLESCDTDKNNECITAYTIQENPAVTTQLSQLMMNPKTSGSLYMSQINEKKHLIHISNATNNYSILQDWYQPFYWQNNTLDITFVDVSEPNNMQVSTTIQLDAALISSRLVNGVLYLVTRKNPSFEFPEIFIPELENISQTYPENNPIAPKNQELNDLLPVISIAGGNKTPLVHATDCYIPSQSSRKSIDNTLMTVTAIPLDNPSDYYATCIVGNIDTFYMSTKALYLTSSRYPINISGNSLFYEADDAEIETEIHKFSLGEGFFDYRGSGTVLGHLGWDVDKQPFRMGEHEGILKVATSRGRQWDGTSTSSVTLLREAPDKQKLDIISTLDNLGKPGERIYAARFIGKRGYLVTFKKVDPLYVLDFSQPDQPKILGELEINGYSDYLHPIGENYLLGIGKDAIAEEGEDFSWYQGVKLSLFDVSSGDNLREIDSIVLGKRGTESAVLMDHHALAWLASSDDSATLAIPVQLNNQKLYNDFEDYSQPSAYYDWTHTGLYTFNINTGTNPSIKLEGKLITNSALEQCDESNYICFAQGQETSNDRAVIQGNSVHYIHNNAVYSSLLADLN